jgi:hypothetical protein
MKRFFQGLAAVLSLGAGLSAAPRLAHAEDPELNPYECLGRYEAATGNRTISQIKQEIQKRLPELDNKDEPKSVNAMKHCVVAMLMSRTGDGDAPVHYEKAVQNAPQEPGYELWWANHYSMFRGARSPVLETAERHYYASLEKLDKLRAGGKYRAYHAVVEEWTKKRLMVLYQQDGLHLIPGKQYPQKSFGLYAPGFSVGAIASISKDTRDFNRKGDWNEMRTFTLEREFGDADVRAGGANRPAPYGKGLRDFEKYAIPRAPLRYHLDAKLRYRQNPIGAFDFTFDKSHAEQAQITSFYFPAGCSLAPLCTELDGSLNGVNDVDVRQIGGHYERVLPPKSASITNASIARAWSNFCRTRRKTSTYTRASWRSRASSARTRSPPSSVTRTCRCRSARARWWSSSETGTFVRRCSSTRCIRRWSCPA